MKTHDLFYSFLFIAGCTTTAWIISRKNEMISPHFLSKIQMEPSHFQLKTSSPINPSLEVKSEIAKKLETLNEIFLTRNDNDPRLDHDFNDLSAQAKEALEEKYQQLQVENRNARGTIVFLVGKNLNSNQDFNFLKKVISEPPCLSLSQCSTRYPGRISDHESATEVTLEYPQIVVLKSLEKYLHENPNSDKAWQIIQQAQHSKSTIINQMATSIERSITHQSFLLLLLPSASKTV